MIVLQVCWICEPEENKCLAYVTDIDPLQEAIFNHLKNVYCSVGLQDLSLLWKLSFQQLSKHEVNKHVKQCFYTYVIVLFH